MDTFSKVAILTYGALSGGAVICAGIARVFPKQLWAWKAASVLGVLAVDAQKIMDIVETGKVVGPGKDVEQEAKK